MKLLKKITEKKVNYLLIMMTILLIFLFTEVETISLLKKEIILASDGGDVDLNNIINVGFTSFKGKEDILRNPIKLLNKNKIFDYKVNVKTSNFGNLIVSTSPYHFSEKKKYNYVDENMMKDINSQTVLGTYRITNYSPAHYVEGSLFVKDVLSATVYSDTYETLEIQHNKSENFPSTTKEFNNDCYNTFYKIPVKKSHSLKFGPKNLQENSEILLPILDFYKKYGTHIVNRVYFGYKKGNRDNTMKTESNKNANESTDENGNPEVSEVAGNKDANNSNKKDFTIGSCQVADERLKINTCDINDPFLVKFEIQPIAELFSPYTSTNDDLFIVDGKPLEKSVKDKIYHTMSLSLEMIEDATRLSKMAVINFDTVKLDAKTPNSPCYKTESFQSTVKSIFNNYSNKNRKRYLQKQLKSVKKCVPVVRVVNYGKIETDLAIITSGNDGLYASQTLSYPLPGDDSMGQMTQEFYLDIRYVSIKDVDTFKKSGYTCTEIWTFEDKNNDNERIQYYYCYFKTKNPFNTNIIIDTKFFEFDKDTYTCVNGFKKTYLDYYNYTCNCEIDFSLISDRPNQGDTFFCIARARSNLFAISGEVNQPKFDKRIVKILLPDEIKKLDNLNSELYKKVGLSAPKPNEDKDDD